MDMRCRFPGCVCLAKDGGDLCVVHVDPSAGNACPSCAGTGWLRPQSPCDRCGGIGLRDAKVARARRRKEDLADERGIIRLASEG